MVNINAKEWQFVLLIGTFVIFLITLPILFGYLATPPNHLFLFRVYINSPDVSVYFSQIEQAKSGQLLFKNLFTSEDQPLGVFNPFWLFIGIFAKLFSLPSFLAFHIARLLLGVVFLIVAYLLIALFFQEEIKRKICFIFLVFASGWGWIVDISPGKYFNVLDLSVPDAFSFTTLYFSPHNIASLVLIILIFLLSIVFFNTHRQKYTFFSGFCALLLFSFHPYHIYSVFGILGMYVIIDAILHKKINIYYGKHLFIVVLFSLPAILYHLWTVVNIPIVHWHFIQNVTLTPSPHVLVISYGLLLPLAAIGTVPLFKKEHKTAQDVFLLVWFFTQLALLYAPIKTQIRLVEGWQCVIAILVTYGLFYLKDFLPKKCINYFNFLHEKNRVIKKVIFFCACILIFIALFCLSSIDILVKDLKIYLNHGNYTYISRENIQAMDWLRNNTPENSIIFSLSTTGNLVPVFSLRKVFVGHFHETIYSEEKYELASGFFRQSTSQERLALLKEYSISYLFFGPQEKREASFNPDDDTFLQKVFENREVEIYLVNSG